MRKTRQSADQPLDTSRAGALLSLWCGMKNPLWSPTEALCNFWLSFHVSAPPVSRLTGLLVADIRTPEGTHRCAPFSPPCCRFKKYPISHCGSFSPNRIPPLRSDAIISLDPAGVWATLTMKAVLDARGTWFGLSVLWYAQDTAIMMSIYPAVVLHW